MRTIAFCIGAMLAAGAAHGQQVTYAPDGVQILVDGQPFSPYAPYTQAQVAAINAFLAGLPQPPPTTECQTPYPSLPALCPPFGDGGINPPHSQVSTAADSADTYAMRYSVVQASVGQHGRELAFVILLNLEDTPQHTTVEYAIADGTRRVYLYTLAPHERLSVGLHTLAEFSGAQFFSLVAYFTKSGAVEVVWHRVSDFAQVDTKAGVLVPKL